MNSPRRSERPANAAHLAVETMEDRSVLSGFGLSPSSLLASAVSTTSTLAASVAAPAAFVADATAATTSSATSALTTAAAPVSEVANLVAPIVSTVVAPLADAAAPLAAPLAAVTAPITGAVETVVAPVAELIASSPILDNPVVETIGGAVGSIVPQIIDVNASLGLGALAGVDLGLAVGGPSLFDLSADVAVLPSESGGLLQTGLDATVGGDSLVAAAAEVAAAGQLVGLDVVGAVGGAQAAVVGVSTEVAGATVEVVAHVGAGSSGGASGGLIDVVIGSTGPLPGVSLPGVSIGTPIGPGVPGLPGGDGVTAPTLPGLNSGQQLGESPLAAAADAVAQASAAALAGAGELEEALAGLDENRPDSIFDVAGNGEFVFSFAGWDMGGLAAKVLPLLLTADLSSDGVMEFSRQLGSLLASATMSELAALQSALDSFLADLDVLAGRVAESAGSIVPWLAVASIAALGASEIVRRDMQRRRTELRRAVAFA